MKPGKPLKHEKKEKEVAATDMDSHSAAGAEE
jgi:cytochrome o ubiquinol oxidase subunit 2